MKRLSPCTLATWMLMPGLLVTLAEPGWTGWRVGVPPTVPPVEIGQVVRPLALDPSVQAPLAAAYENDSDQGIEPPVGTLAAYTPEVETVSGYTFGTVTSPTVVGGIAGAAIGTHGIDNVQSGARQLWTGEPVDTMTSGLLQSAGLSHQTANTVNAVISVVATLGTGAANTAAATAPTSFADDFVTVSRWGREGLQAGDWVMKGSVNRSNYILSGKYQPQSWPGNNIPASFSSGQEFTVPSTTLHTPNGVLGQIKGTLGQRIYNP